MIAVIVYLLAGVGAYWAFYDDPRWRRLLLVVVWLPMLVYALAFDFVDWWRRRGYQYPPD